MGLFDRIKDGWKAASRATEKDRVFDNVPRGVDGQTAELPAQNWLDVATAIEQYGYDIDDPAGLLLGRLGDQLIGVEDDRHVVTTAGSRSGKGVSMILPNLLTYPGSVLCIDPKGENASITARYRAETLGQTVYVLDPFERTASWCEPYRKRYNPLASLTPDNPYIIEDAGTIADALIEQGGGDQTHWDGAARTFLRGVLLHVATDLPFEGYRDLTTVYDLIMKGRDLGQIGEMTYEGLDGLRFEMVNNEAIETIERAALDFFQKPEKERESVLSSLRRQIEWLEYPAMQEVLSGHDFDLSDLKTGKCTIYLCLPVGRLATCNKWLRLFVNQVLEMAERTEGKVDPPVLLLLDEFANLGHLQNILTASSYLAGFSCKLHIILQSLTQIKSIYKDGWETLLANAGTLQFFGNSNDMTTLKYIQDMLGKTTTEVASKGRYSPQEREKAGDFGMIMAFMEKELSHSPHQFDFLTAAEAASLFRREDEYGRQLVLQAGQPPMILQRLSYFSDPWFRDGKGHPIYDEVE